MKVHDKVRVALAVGLLASSGAWAHGGGGHGGGGYGYGRPAMRGAPLVVRPGYVGPRVHFSGPRVWAPPVVVYGTFGYPYGPALYGPTVYGPAPYYAPPVVAVPAEPPVYIEQQSQGPQAYWYWCQAPQGYHPTVQECPGGWQPVMPQPPAQP